MTRCEKNDRTYETRSDRVRTKLQTKELKKLSNFINYFRTTNSNVTKETENLVRIEDVKIVYKILLGKSEENIPLIRQKFQNKLKMS